MLLILQQFESNSLRFDGLNASQGFIKTGLKRDSKCIVLEKLYKIIKTENTGIGPNIPSCFDLQWSKDSIPMIDSLPITKKVHR